MKKQLLPALLVALSLSWVGCATDEVVLQGGVDQTERTIIVHSMGGGPTGAVKAVLRAHDWEVASSQQPAGAGDALVVKPEAESWPTRYTLYLSFDRKQGGAVSMESLYDYQISIVDNHSGVEVLKLHGWDSQKRIARRLGKALDTHS